MTSGERGRERPLGLPVAPGEALLVRALGDDRAALEELATQAVGEQRIPARLLPALALGADRHGLPVPEPWRQARLRSAAIHLALAHMARELGRTLAEADGSEGNGVPWMPIKGWDLATRSGAHGSVYRAPEERPSGDLDLLVPEGAFEAARRALEAAGWRTFHGPSSEPPAPEDLPRLEAYRRDEGYAWQAVHPEGGLLLEVHFRLWGTVPESLVRRLWERARPDPSLDPSSSTGHRADRADAYLLAAIHAFLHGPPRTVAPWWDLAAIARGVRAEERGENEEDTDHLAERVIAAAREHGLQLPLCLAAAQVASLLDAAETSPDTGRETHEKISRALATDLRPAEAAVLRRAHRRGLDAVDLGRLTLARLLSARPGRAGWRSLPRRLWAHPGVVAQETAATANGRPRPWPLRRLEHLWGQVTGRS